MCSATAIWDFWSLSPESMHQVTILMMEVGCARPTGGPVGESVAGDTEKGVKPSKDMAFC